MLSQILAQRIYNPQIILPIQNFTGWQYLQRLYPILLILGFIICVVVFVLIIIIGGIQWITSGGERSAIDNARRKVINGITGLVILLLVFFAIIVIGRIFGVNLLGSFQVQTKNISPKPAITPGVPTPTLIISPDQQGCLASGGTWTQFPTACGDNCVQNNCLNVVTWACDCGVSQCWLGGNCVANPVFPTATTAPPGPIIIQPSPTPTPYPTSTPLPTATPTIRPANTPTPTICPLPPLVTGQTPVGTTSCGLTTLTFAWNAGSSSTPTQYAIRVDESPVSWSGTCTLINTGDTCIDNLFSTSYTRSVVPGRTYRWWVDAINSCGWSTTAVQYDVTVPVCPTNTPIPTSTPRPTNTPTPTVTLSPVSPSATPIPFPTPIPTNTPTPIPTATPTPNPTFTPTPIPIPPTATPTPIPLFCNDSDGGQNYYQQGTVTDNTTLPGGQIEYKTDYCISGSAVYEYFCNGIYRSQITNQCVSTTGAVCFNGECCSWVNQDCSTDSDCCTNYACQGGKCVSPTILLNEAFNMSCRNYCMDSGFSGCISIGTDTLASNGMAYIYPGFICTLTNTYTCDTVIYISSGVCGGHQTEWTRCRCAPSLGT
jgi:hypothetical protein